MPASLRPLCGNLDTVYAHGAPTLPPDDATPHASGGYSWSPAPGVRAEVGTWNAGRDTRYTIGPAALWSVPMRDIAASLPPIREVYGFHYAVDFHVPRECTVPVLRSSTWGSTIVDSHRHSRHAADLIENTLVRWQRCRKGKRAGLGGIRRGYDGSTVWRGARETQQTCLYLKTADHERCAGQVPHYLDTWTAHGYPGLVCDCGPSDLDMVPPLPSMSGAYKSTCPRCQTPVRWSPVVRLEQRFGRPYTKGHALSLLDVEERAANFAAASLGVRLTTSAPQVWRFGQVRPERLTVSDSDRSIEGLLRYHSAMARHHVTAFDSLAMRCDAEDRLGLAPETLKNMEAAIFDSSATTARAAVAGHGDTVARVRDAIDGLRDLAATPRNPRLRDAREHRNYVAGLREAIRALEPVLAQAEAFGPL